MSSITEILPVPIPDGTSKTDSQYPQPLKQSGSLENFGIEDVTPVTGREFPLANDFLNVSDPDTLLHDLAITNELQKRFVHRVGELTGKPATSSLRTHPVLNGSGEFGDDAQISNISSVSRKKLFAHIEQKEKRKYDSAQWHSDIQFEPVPADYTSLRLTGEAPFYDPNSRTRTEALAAA